MSLLHTFPLPGALALALMLTAVARGQAEDDTPLAGELKAILAQQTQSWNEGDIDGFMKHYWQSEKLSLSSNGQTVRGWKQIRENYLRRYPDREAMGRAAFSQLEITPLGDQAALVLGRWNLERQAGPLGGNFTLIFRKLNGRWLIVHDHTSRASEGPG